MRGSFAIGLVLAATMSLGTARAADDVSGMWMLSSGEIGGQALNAEQLAGGKLVILADHYSVTLAGHDTVTGTQKLDATATPKTIDITDTDGPNAGKTCLGIYEFSGDELRVTFAPPGEPRPTRFSTAPTTMEWMHVWKRVKE